MIDKTRWMMGNDGCGQAALPYHVLTCAIHYVHIWCRRASWLRAYIVSILYHNVSLGSQMRGARYFDHIFVFGFDVLPSE